MSNQTLDYYNHNAATFIEGTLEADMTSTHERFLAYLHPYAHILDAGCGSGRDSLAFLKAGCTVTAMDGSEELCKKASELIGQTVRHQYFEDIDEVAVYDGIWACATLLHVPSASVQLVLRKMVDALKVGGYFYMSFKCGEYEGMRNGRHFTDYTEESLEKLLSHFEELQIVEKWQTVDARPDRDERWVNVIVKKI